jgi:hypothetical protein
MTFTLQRVDFRGIHNVSINVRGAFRYQQMSTTT